MRGEKNNKKLIFSYTILDCTVPKLECHYLLMPNVLAFRTPNVREFLVRQMLNIWHFARLMRILLTVWEKKKKEKHMSWRVEEGQNSAKCGPNRWHVSQNNANNSAIFLLVIWNLTNQLINKESDKKKERKKNGNCEHEKKNLTRRLGRLGLEIKGESERHRNELQSGGATSVRWAGGAGGPAQCGSTRAQAQWGPRSRSCCLR